MRSRAQDFHIILDDVSITHLTFSHEFTKAVEAKQVAEQDAQRASFVVMKAEQERLAAVIKAEGESEAAKMISEATKAHGSGMIELRRIEAAKEIASTLARGRNVTYLPNAGNILMNVGAQQGHHARYAAGPCTAVLWAGAVLNRHVRWCLLCGNAFTRSFDCGFCKGVSFASSACCSQRHNPWAVVVNVNGRDVRSERKQPMSRSCAF
eukprot:TRINITY_DN11379_c0_g1_i1.p1 TRINITY_DN11379_c0_g1~~TRINITY_DN11379_c0_g1_i1.p1  ORF type:complete len:238 (-),score=28.75 TRINITY_DN11379_c0_g1_i1:225-851(-)